MNRQQLIAELKDYRILGHKVLVKLSASTDKLQSEHDRLELEINGVTSCELTCDVIGYDEYVHGLDGQYNKAEYGEGHSYAWKYASSPLPEGVNESLGSQCGGVTVATINDSETSVNLSEIQLTDQSDYQVLPLQTKFSHYSYFTLDTQLTYMRFENEFHPVEVDLESKPKTVKDLITQETHLWDDMFFTAFYGSPYNLEQDNIVATVTSNNKFKGIRGQTSFQTNLVTAVEIAKNYLATGVNTVKVPCTHKRLTTNIFSNRYVLMPTINADTYTKLLLIHLEATTGYSNLESKSIYA